MNKKVTCAILAAAMMGTAFAGCSKSDKLDGTQIVATVDDYEVTLGMAHLILRESQASAEDYMDYLAQYYAYYYGSEIASGSMWDDKVEDGSQTYGEQQKEEVMGTICELYAFKNHAADYGIELTEEDNAKIAAAAKQFMEDNTQKAIDALGVSESDIVTYLELATIRAKMYEPMLADVDCNVSEEESNQTTLTYATLSIAGTETDKDGNKIALTEEQLAEKKALCEKLIQALNDADDTAKADMAALAKEISEDFTVTTASFTTSAYEEQYAVNEALAEAVLTLKDGEVYADVIEGTNNVFYYVGRLDAMVDEEATAEKVDTIITERKTEAHKELAEKWTYETEVKIDYNVWSQVELTDRQSFRFVETDSTEE